MERRLERKIDGAEAGKSVKSYLKNLGLTERQISRIKFREGGITVNGSPVTVRYALKEGDALSLLLFSDAPGRDVREGSGKKPQAWLSQVEEASALLPGQCEGGKASAILPGQSKKGEASALLPRQSEALWAPPAGGLPPLNIVYEDEDILVADKPHGLPTHPSHGHFDDTLANQAAAYLGIRYCRDLHVIGRLDKDTGGLVLFARNAAAASILSQQRQQKKLEKRYLALVYGSPADEQGSIDLPLAREAENINRMIVSEAGKSAITHYRCLWSREGKSLLELTLEQGRTHQIRAHLSAIGCPIVGDPVYGSEGDSCRMIYPRKNGEFPADEAGAEEVRTAESSKVLHLQAHSLRFVQPFTGEGIFLEAKWPSWLP